MGLFFPSDPIPVNGRATGFARYREVLERDWTHFLVGGLVATAAFIPFGLGMFIAFVSSSFLIALAAGVVGGMFFGPFLYALIDGIFRALRDAPGPWVGNFYKSARKNLKSALLPGAVLGVFLSTVIFMGMQMFIWSETAQTAGTIAISVTSLILSSMLFTTYWAQLVLFEQSLSVRLKNCILFCVKYFWKTLGTAVLQVAFWIIAALFFPWSIFVLPFIGLWTALFLTFFFLYKSLNEAFSIEEEIKKHFPEQVPSYTDDIDFHIDE